LIPDVIHSEPPCYIDVKLLDGAAEVHLLPTANVSTFGDHADQIFLPHAYICIKIIGKFCTS